MSETLWLGSVHKWGWGTHKIIQIDSKQFMTLPAIVQYKEFHTMVAHLYSIFFEHIHTNIKQQITATVSRGDFTQKDSLIFVKTKMLSKQFSYRNRPNTKKNNQLKCHAKLSNKDTQCVIRFYTHAITGHPNTRRITRSVPRRETISYRKLMLRLRGYG